MKRIWFAFNNKTRSYVYAASGTQLAEKLGLCSSAVYSAIRKAKTKGYNCRYGWFESEDEE